MNEKKENAKKDKILPIKRLRKKANRSSSIARHVPADGQQDSFLEPLGTGFRARYEEFKKRKHEEELKQRASAKEGQPNASKDHRGLEVGAKKEEGTTPATLPSGKTVYFWDPTLSLKEERKRRRKKGKTEPEREPR